MMNSSASSHIPKPRNICFISSNQVWGGSEELWYRTALTFAKGGHRVSVYKPFIADTREATVLRDSGCRFHDLAGPRHAPTRLRKLVSQVWKASRYLQDRLLARGLRALQPDLVVVSQGLNYDGWYAGEVCRKLGIPFVLVSQKASDLYWPHDRMHAELRGVFGAAQRAFFVSEHNLRLTEEQLGMALPNGILVRNPYNADWSNPLPWPNAGAEESVRLACLARLDAREKGQDLLLRVLAMPKWRTRDISVQFYGSGHNANGLKGMAAYLGLENIQFPGYSATPAKIWETAHGLILPSRCEGLPLSLVEAMLSGRVAIVTDVAGNREALQDGVSGFLAESATEAALDAALERAWQQRGSWPSIGRQAAEAARSLVSPDPVGEFKAMLEDLIPSDRRETAAKG